MGRLVPQITSRQQQEPAPAVWGGSWQENLLMWQDPAVHTGGRWGHPQVSDHLAGARSSRCQPLLVRTSQQHA
jgi:hypothetical protein